MKRSRFKIDNTSSSGTSTFVQLPDRDCLRKEQGVATPCSMVMPCTWPPALLAMQLHVRLQWQTYLHIILSIGRTENTYDNFDRLISNTQRGRTVNYIYDSNGNRTQVAATAATTDYTFDNRNRLKTAKVGDETTTYTYTPAGKKDTVSYPNGMTVDYTYDQNNQLTGVNIPYAGGISYNAYQWTRPTGVTLPSASGTKAYAYDELMRTKTILSKDASQNNLMSYQYTYDKMDNIKTRNTQAGNYAYTYDNLYRLGEVKKDEVQKEAYTYDPVGNRQTSLDASDWAHNTNNELTSYNGVTYQYDLNGNTIQQNVNGQIRNFVYDVDNRLIEVRDAVSALIASYTYDPFGRRIKKIVSPSGGGAGEVVTYYHYSDEGLIGEYDSSGNATRIVTIQQKSFAF